MSNFTRSSSSRVSRDQVGLVEGAREQSVYEQGERFVTLRLAGRWSASPARRAVAPARSPSSAACDSLASARPVGRQAVQAHAVGQMLGEAVEELAPGEGALRDLAVQEATSRFCCSRLKLASWASSCDRPAAASLIDLHRQAGELRRASPPSCDEVVPEQRDVAEQEQRAEQPEQERGARHRPGVGNGRRARLSGSSRSGRSVIGGPRAGASASSRSARSCDLLPGGAEHRSELRQGGTRASSARSGGRWRPSTGAAGRAEPLRQAVEPDRLELGRRRAAAPRRAARRGSARRGSCG